MVNVKSIALHFFKKSRNIRYINTEVQICTHLVNSGECIWTLDMLKESFPGLLFQVREDLEGSFPSSHAKCVSRASCCFRERRQGDFSWGQTEEVLPLLQIWRWDLYSFGTHIRDFAKVSQVVMKRKSSPLQLRKGGIASPHAPTLTYDMLIGSSPASGEGIHDGQDRPGILAG